MINEGTPNKEGGTWLCINKFVIYGKGKSAEAM